MFNLCHFKTLVKNHTICCSNSQLSKSRVESVSSSAPTPLSLPSWGWQWKLAASQDTRGLGFFAPRPVEWSCDCLLWLVVGDIYSLDEEEVSFDLFLQLKAVHPDFWRHNCLQASKLLRSKPKFGQSESRKWFSDSWKPGILLSKDEPQFTWLYREILKASPLAPEVKQLKVKKPQFNFFF